MKLSSPTFENSQLMPRQYGYREGNISPGLAISGVPNDTVRLALIVHDPDAPIGDYTHWLVWNISLGTTGFVEGNVPPDTTTGTNDYGQTDWGGPAPPSGTHRYFFELYALDTALELPPTTNRQGLEAAILKHVLEHTQLIGLYAAP